MKAILVEETNIYKTYRFEYTEEELERFKKGIIELFKGTKYEYNYEYSTYPSME